MRTGTHLGLQSQDSKRKTQRERCNSDRDRERGGHRDTGRDTGRRGFSRAAGHLSYWTCVRGGVGMFDSRAPLVGSPWGAGARRLAQF